MLNIKRLEYFCNLAREGNFTRAAKQLGIAQPALTIAVQKLEQEFDLKLINRSEKKAHLTADGKVFYQSALKLLAQAKQMKQEVAGLTQGTQGKIKIGVSSMMGSYFFPRILTAFKQSYPQITIHLVDQGTATLENMLLNGELDLALLRHDVEHEQLRYKALLEEEVVAALAKNHPLAGEKTLTLMQFCRQPLVLFHQGYFLRESVSEYAKEHQIPLDIRMETNLIELQKAMVASGIGITTCLARIVGREKDISVVPFAPKMKFKLGLGWKKNCYLSKASQVFIDFLVEKTASKNLE